MEVIDWGQVHLQGYRELVRVVEVICGEVQELGRRVEELRAAQPTVVRLEPVWFRRYVELYGMLVEAGMPPDAEGAEVAGWLSGRCGAARTPANVAGGRIALATGWNSEVIADLGGGWKIEAVEVPEGENASRIYFNRFQER